MTPAPKKAKLIRKTSSVEKYIVYPDHDCKWASFVIDEYDGSLQIMSDFGDWSYLWGPNHGRKSFKHFLVEIEKDPSYLTMKLGQGQDTVLDIDRTISAVKDIIIFRRRNLDFSREEAREAWDEILEIKQNRPKSSLEFYLIVQDYCPKLHDLLGGECEPPTVTTYPSNLKRFVTEIFPAFAEHLREELTIQG